MVKIHLIALGLRFGLGDDASQPPSYDEVNAVASLWAHCRCGFSRFWFWRSAYRRPGMFVKGGLSFEVWLEGAYMRAVMALSLMVAGCSEAGVSTPDTGPGGLVDADLVQRFPILPEWRDRYGPEVTENLEHLWYLPVPEILPVTLNPDEHLQHRWLPLDKAISTVTSWTNRAALEKLRQ